MRNLYGRAKEKSRALSQRVTQEAVVRKTNSENVCVLLLCDVRTEALESCASPTFAHTRERERDRASAYLSYGQFWIVNLPLACAAESLLLLQKRCEKPVCARFTMKTASANFPIICSLATHTLKLSRHPSSMLFFLCSYFSLPALHSSPLTRGAGHRGSQQHALLWTRNTLPLSMCAVLYSCSWYEERDAENITTKIHIIMEVHATISRYWKNYFNLFRLLFSLHSAFLDLSNISQEILQKWHNIEFLLSYS